MRLLAATAVLSLLALSACDVTSEVLNPKPAPSFTGSWEDNSAGGQTVSQNGVNSYRSVTISQNSDVVMWSSKNLAGSDSQSGTLNIYALGALDQKSSSVVFSKRMKESATRDHQTLQPVSVKLVSEDTLVWSQNGMDVVYKKVDAAVADQHMRDYNDAIIHRDAALASFKNYLNGRQLVLLQRQVTRRVVDNSIPAETRTTPASAILPTTQTADGSFRYNVTSLRALNADFIINDSLPVKLVPAFDIQANAFVVSIFTNGSLVTRAQVDGSNRTTVLFKGPEFHLPMDASGRDVVQQTTDTYEYR